MYRDAPAPPRHVNLPADLLSVFDADVAQASRRPTNELFFLNCQLTDLLLTDPRGVGGGEGG
jgi:hypothetical protein